MKEFIDQNCIIIPSLIEAIVPVLGETYILKNRKLRLQI